MTRTINVRSFAPLIRGGPSRQAGGRAQGLERPGRRSSRVHETHSESRRIRVSLRRLLRASAARWSSRSTKAYPGLYVPRALEVEPTFAEESQKTLVREILALIKMNWNNTQPDSSLPITVRAARQIGDILKYAGNLKQVQMRYAFHM